MFGGMKRIPADLHLALPVGLHLAAEMFGQHLRAKTDAEKGLVFLQRHLQPVDFGFDVVMRIVSAHRSAEDDGARVFLQRLRQVVAERRAPYIQTIPFFHQHLADAAGRGTFLMQDDEQRWLFSLLPGRVKQHRLRFRFLQRARTSWRPADVAEPCRARIHQAGRRLARSHGLPFRFVRRQRKQYPIICQ